MSLLMVTYERRDTLIFTNKTDIFTERQTEVISIEVRHNEFDMKTGAKKT